MALRLSPRSAAYTLVEIMLVLSIIAVLMAAGIYYLVGNLDVAKRTRVQSDLETLTTQLKVYQMQNFNFPTTQQGLQALVTPPTAPPAPRQWVQLMKPDGLLDPWGSTYQYMCPGKHNPTSFDLWSMGPEKVNGPNVIGNWGPESR
jgi:general secretion pathway protein G